MDRGKVIIKPTDPRFRLMGRWASSDSKSIIAQWCGAQIAFTISRCALLKLRVGGQTRRVDKFNGGTPMLACTLYRSRTDSPVIRTFEPRANEDLVILPAEETYLISSSKAYERVKRYSDTNRLGLNPRIGCNHHRLSTSLCQFIIGHQSKYIS